MWQRRGRAARGAAHGTPGACDRGVAERLRPHSRRRLPGAGSSLVSSVKLAPASSSVSTPAGAVARGRGRKRGRGGVRPGAGARGVPPRRPAARSSPRAAWGGQAGALWLSVGPLARRAPISSNRSDCLPSMPSLMVSLRWAGGGGQESGARGGAASERRCPLALLAPMGLRPAAASPAPPPASLPRRRPRAARRTRCLERCPAACATRPSQPQRPSPPLRAPPRSQAPRRCGGPRASPPAPPSAGRTRPRCKGWQQVGGCVCEVQRKWGEQPLAARRSKKGSDVSARFPLPTLALSSSACCCSCSTVRLVSQPRSTGGGAGGGSGVRAWCAAPLRA
jgi:hypothetical protein